MTKNIITIEGYNQITSLYEKLQKENRHWTEEKRIAAQQGDFKENSEYIYAKANIRELDKRIRRLKFIIEKTKAVDISKRKKPDIVLFGSKVRLLQNDKELIIKVVGTYELDYLKKKEGFYYISNISPLGYKLMRKEVGDEVYYKEYTYEILEILS